MRLASPWTPRLATGSAAPSERLIAALASDIADGVAPPGARLPPHRELAYRLGVGVGTVTKAYAALERRGLVQSVRGRGMFVAGDLRLPVDVVDLSVNAPPQMLSDRLLAASLTRLAKQLGAGTFGAYAPPAGLPTHRRLMARWLADQGCEFASERILLCNGAQHALSIAFAVACVPGGTLLTEAITYPGAIALGRRLGQSMIGLPLDAEGVIPEALERALVRSTGPQALYVTPTAHNPTTATMGLERRMEIVRLCRKHDVVIIEDDVYSTFGEPGVRPLASLAEERTMYVGGLSKTLSPGLRIGALAVPPDRIDRAHAELQATCTTASPLNSLIMEQWLTDGTALAVAASIRSEAARRVELAHGILALPPASPPSRGFHIWLPMTTAKALAVADAADRIGVRVLAPTAPLVDPESPSGGIRLSLGAAPIDALRWALTAIKGLIDDGGAEFRAAAIGP